MVELLGNPVAKLSEYDLKHFASHCVESGDIQQLHRLLALETEQKRHAWFEAKEFVGDTAGFSSDVQLAWEQADAAYSESPSKAIGLQCRYALITASVNTMSGNISLVTISVLLEKGIWSPDQGLAHARQIKFFPNQVKALGIVATYLPEVWDEVFEGIENIGDEENTSRVLKDLSSHFPKRMMVRALSITQRVLIKEEFLADAIQSFIPYLPDHLLVETLDSIKSIEDESHRLESLISLSLRLPDISAEILKAIRNMSYGDNRLSIFCSLVSHLPENCLSDALSLARDEKDTSKKAKMLRSLLPIYSKALPEALTTVRKIKNESQRSFLFRSYSPYITNESLPEALYIARVTNNKLHRVTMLSSLVPYSHDILKEASAIARSITDTQLRVEALCSLASYSHMICTQAIELLLENSKKPSIKSIGTNSWQGSALHNLAPHIHSILMPKALMIAWRIRRYERINVLCILAPRMSTRLALKTVEIAKTLLGKYSGSDVDYAETVAAFVPYHPEILPEAISAALHIEETHLYRKAEILRSFIPYEPQICSEALEAARSIPKKDYIIGDDRTKALDSLAYYLPKHLLSSLLDASRYIGDDYPTAEALCSFALYFPEVLPNALSLVRMLKSDYQRAKLLNSLTQYLPELWMEVLEVAQRIDHRLGQAEVVDSIELSSIENYFPQIFIFVLSINRDAKSSITTRLWKPLILENLLATNIKVINSIEDSYMLRLLGPLATYLPRQLSLQASKCLEGILKKARYRSPPYVELSCPRVPYPNSVKSLSRLLKTTKTIKDSCIRAITLGAVSLIHPQKNSFVVENKRAAQLISFAFWIPDLWVEALDATFNIEIDSYPKAIETGRLSARIPASLIPFALEGICNIKNEEHRATVIESLAFNLPSELIPQVLNIIIDINDEPSKGKSLSSLVQVVSKSNDLIFPYSFWREVIHNQSSLRRRELLHRIEEHSDVVHKLGGSHAFRELVIALQDVRRWFP